MLDFTPKLIAFDLDGTLTESKQNLDPAMGRLLSRLMGKVPIAVLSGGSFDQFQKQFLWGLPNDIPPDRLYIFPTNAAQCYLWQDGTWRRQYDHSFSKEEKEKIIAAIDTALAETHFPQPEQLWGPQIEDRDAQITFSALGQLAPPEIKQQWDPTREKRRPLFNRLVKQFPEYTIGLNASTSIDIVKKGNSKAYGLRELSRSTGISLSEMIYVGDALWDDGNDSIVKETGVRTLQVSGPEETAQFIESFLKES